MDPTWANFLCNMAKLCCKAEILQSHSIAVSDNDEQTQAGQLMLYCYFRHGESRSGLSRKGFNY